MGEEVNIVSILLGLLWHIVLGIGLIELLFKITDAPTNRTGISIGTRVYLIFLIGFLLIARRFDDLGKTEGLAKKCLSIIGITPFPAAMIGIVLYQPIVNIYEDYQKKKEYEAISWHYAIDEVRKKKNTLNTKYEFYEEDSNVKTKENSGKIHVIFTFNSIDSSERQFTRSDVDYLIQWLSSAKQDYNITLLQYGYRAYGFDLTINPNKQIVGCITPDLQAPSYSEQEKKQWDSCGLLGLTKK
ncbi:hypothetical protein [Aneurinibacillus tyrosinisolvens]|uniref:hypothetical protein n=1 Tax=Aneurinibacillus tyrosinisolvens TaxID=1443435 RepID=UPI00063F0413|nr:hypothetical protein [Aneurinibacillus tyrosinisolvens]